MAIPISRPNYTRCRVSAAVVRRKKRVEILARSSSKVDIDYASGQRIDVLLWMIYLTMFINVYHTLISFKLV